MLGTLNEHQKSDWKSYVPTLTHAYNAATHKSTGFPPFYLMYERHPRLSTDAFLDIGDDAVKAGSHAEYVDKLKQRLTSSFEAAARQVETSAKEQKRLFDQNVCNCVLEEGDRVLVRKVGVQGKQKLKEYGRSAHTSSNGRLLLTFQCMKCRWRAQTRRQELFIATCSFHSLVYLSLMKQTCHCLRSNES